MKTNSTFPSAVLRSVRNPLGALSALCCIVVSGIVFAPITSLAPPRLMHRPPPRIDVHVRPYKPSGPTVRKPQPSGLVVDHSANTGRSEPAASYNKGLNGAHKDLSSLKSDDRQSGLDAPIRRDEPTEAQDFSRATLDNSPITRDTIFVYPDQDPNPAAREHINQVASEFLTRVSLPQLPRDVTFVLVSPDSNGGHYATICDAEGMRNSQHFVGESILMGAPPPELLATRLKEVAAEGLIFAFGENDNGALDKASRTAGAHLIRRGPSLKTDLVESAKRNAELAKRPIDPTQVSLLNALPSTEKGLESMRFPTTGIAEWKRFHSALETRLAGRFGTRLNSKKDLLEELKSGTNDIITIVAHNDGKTLFINGEELTYEELDALPQRVIASERPRFCALISCEAVRLSDLDPDGWLMSLIRKGVRALNRESFAELLLKKGFVDQVWAPDHEIQSKETLQIIDDLNSAKKLRDVISTDGWIRLAALRRGFEYNPI
jgi:hypothetical protein